MKILVAEEKKPGEKGELSEIIESGEFPDLSLLSADDGDQCKTMLNEHSDIDIFFLDLNLSNGTGLDILKDIEDLTWDLRIIVISDVYDTRVNQCMKIGAVDFIIRPYDRGQIISSI